MTGHISRRNVLLGGGAIAVSLSNSRKVAALNRAIVHDVEINRFKFVPDHIQVSVGDAIRWTNNDLAPHTATADQFGWDTGELAKDQSVELIVTEGMELSYFCAFHPHMTASLEIVERA
ncbi:plastocyanin/azurin family copper-binding protein [Cochlodiniinecator piscidefendens]|uniref:plastocyanin/azurin family copper-binding protein n=1 Tax=Cochlodiniinecator piscidefendens TaxID=2715756 RepID=UPI00140AEA38|nr:plastocyanin/azurin family copper-binding protein [Cochlodiniinecator piscidefendens]